jgi:hypothetical protein
VVSVLKQGKDPTLPSSYRPLSLLETAGKISEKILITGVLQELKEGGLLREAQFGFRSKQSTMLQLARLIEGANTNCDDRRLTGAVFLDAPKAFNTVWIKGFL